MRVSIATVLSAFALLCLTPMAFAQDADKDDAKPAAENSDSEDKFPEGATEVPAGDDKGTDEKPAADKATEEKPPEGAAEVKEGEPEKRPQGFGKPPKRKSAGTSTDGEEAATGAATGESKSGLALKDLVNDGFVIRTTVFIPAEAVTRQLGKVSGDAVVITLQKQFSTAICYYSFKAYVGGGLTKIASCTVHQ
jgi:hypothetical protein